MKSYNKEQQELLNIRAKNEYKNEYPCDMWGRFPWDCELKSHQIGKTVSLSKSCLGVFVYEVLMRGGNITSFYVFSTTPRGAVFPRVWLTLEARDTFCNDTGFILNSPPVAHIN